MGVVARLAGAKTLRTLPDRLETLEPNDRGTIKVQGPVIWFLTELAFLHAHAAHGLTNARARVLSPAGSHVKMSIECCLRHKINSKSGKSK